MQRKLVKQSKNTLTLALPIQWTRSHNLEAGDTIEINDVEDKLVISSDFKEKKKEITINVTSENTKFIRISLNALYRIGYDRITATFKTKKQSEAIKNTLEKRLLGFEVVEEKNNVMVIENFTEPNEEKQEVLLRRMFLLVKESFEMLQVDLRKGNFSNLQKIITLTERFNRYNSFCRRNISKKRFTQEKGAYHWELYLKLLLIQHSLWHLYEAIVEEKFSTKSVKISTIFTSLQKKYSDLYTSYFSKDIPLLQHVNETTSTYFKEIMQEMKKGKETVLFHYLAELARLLYLTSIPMLAILIE